MKIVELAERLFVRRGDCWDLGRTNSPTSARRGDGLENIKIWATPPKKLVFWDGAPSPSSYNYKQDPNPNLTSCHPLLQVQLRV